MDFGESCGAQPGCAPVEMPSARYSSPARPVWRGTCRSAINNVDARGGPRHCRPDTGRTSARIGRTRLVRAGGLTPQHLCWLRLRDCRRRHREPRLRHPHDSNSHRRARGFSWPSSSRSAPLVSNGRSDARTAHFGRVDASTRATCCSPHRARHSHGTSSSPSAMNDPSVRRCCRRPSIRFPRPLQTPSSSFLVCLPAVSARSQRALTTSHRRAEYCSRRASLLERRPEANDCRRLGCLQRPSRPAGRYIFSSRSAHVSARERSPFILPYV